MTGMALFLLFFSCEPLVISDPKCDWIWQLELVAAMPENIEVKNGTWDSSCSNGVVQASKSNLIESIIFQPDVVFPNNTLPSFEGASILKVHINSSNCEYLSNRCFFNSQIVEFHAVNLQEVSDRAFCYSNLAIFDASTVTSVRFAAFYLCSELMYVKVGTINNIEGYAFYMCSNLASLENWRFAEAVTLGDRAFDMCDSLTDVDMSTFVSIGEKCFSSCNSLRDIQIKCNSTIGTAAFQYCESIVYVHAPHVESVGDRAFMFCLTLTNIDLSSVWCLPNMCFDSCSALENVIVPDNIRAMDSCLNACHALRNINFTFCSIGEWGLAYCLHLEEVILDSVIEIGKDCFAYSDNIKTISLNSLKNCSEGLFTYKAITSFSAAVLEKIPANCLANCTSLVNLYIPMCTEIGAYAFESTRKVTNLSLPHLTRIGDYAFKNSMECYFNDIGVLERIGDRAFESLHILQFTFKDNLTSLCVKEFGDHCFINCDDSTIPDINFSYIKRITGEFTCDKNVDVIDMPNLVTIGECPFKHYWNLTALILPKVVRCYGGIAENCSNLTTIEMNSVKHIEGTFLIKCPNVRSLEFHVLVNCTDRTFENMTKLTSIHINGCTMIGSRVFYGCKRLSSITGSGENIIQATSIGENAFQGCSALTSLTFPHANTIDDSCFKGCRSLESVELPECDKVRGDHHFEGCSNLQRVDLRHIDPGDGVSSTAANIFKDCSKLELIYFSNEAFSLQWNESVFTNSGADLSKIRFCLRSRSQYETISKDIGSDTWYGIPLEPPDDYENTCGSFVEPDPAREELEKFKTGILVASLSVVAILTGVGFVIYKKLYVPAKLRRELDSSLSEQLKLQRTIIDDFG